MYREWKKASSENVYVFYIKTECEWKKPTNNLKKKRKKKRKTYRMTQISNIKIYKDHMVFYFCHISLVFAHISIVKQQE